ncbi:duplicated orphan permease [Acidiphilium rubrum]|uniref:Duplicated orphan permease n=2 Tax=Acidocellaceae TaxID=3385905 RepID=A0A8G2FG95_ACIRU|nr:duplicated orphan permease [Acidiphilium rubrum]
MIGAMANDAATACRGLMRRPFYAVASIVMLALAIGANVTAFGVFYGYNVRALPYHAPSRLMLVAAASQRIDPDDPEISAKTYWALQGRLPSVQSVGLWAYIGPAAAMVDGRAQQVDTADVTPSFLTTLGVRPLIGRLPSVAAGLPSGPHEAVISAQFWRAAFSGSDAVLGRHIVIGGVSERIVGVLPASFGFVSATDLWAAYVPPRTGIPASNGNKFMPVRLAQGASAAQLDVQLTRALQRIEAVNNPAASAREQHNRERLIARPIRPALLGMTPFGALPSLVQAMAVLLLVLAIANAGNLALVRNRARLQDYAIRRILGARRGSLLRLFLLEQVPIVLAVGAGGALIGWVALQDLQEFQPIFHASPFGIATGAPAQAFGLALTLVSLLLVASGPSVQIWRQTLGDRADHGTRATLSPGARRTQNALGALQVGLAAILLIGSAALSISLHQILTQQRGFQTKGRVVASVLMPPALANLTVLGRVVDAVSHLPGIAASGGSLEWSYPLTKTLIEVGVFPDRPRAQAEGVYFVPIVGHYFRALGIDIAAGHGFGLAAKAASCHRDLIVSQDLAQASFAKGAIGKQLNLAGDLYPIIGVTPRLLWQPSGKDGISGTMFFPAACLATLKAPFPFRGATIIADARGGPRAAISAIDHAIGVAAPGAVVTSIEPYSQVIFASTAFRTLIARLVAAFAALALLLAALGVYAVNAFIARARLPEFGLRAMLGADAGRLLRTALVDAAWVLAAGLTGGAIGGFFLVRMMQPVLFHIGAVLPWIFAAALGLIAIVVIMAAWRPASQAANLPVKTLLDAG